MYINQNQIGRREIFCEEREINDDNLIPVLQKAYNEHLENLSRINYLLRYEAGEQPLKREKIYRPEIDCECVDNVAAEIVEFHLGFVWGNPITFVQRGVKDSGTETESEAISLLNEAYLAENVNAKTQELGRFVEIAGIGYTFVDIVSEWQEGDSPFEIETLDPRYAFVVKSSIYPDKRPVLGVTYRESEKGIFFTCFTDSRRYEVVNLTNIAGSKEIVENSGYLAREKDWRHGNRSGELNPLGMIPIIEWIRSYDRMGVFERQISEMDNLNLLISDMTNDVDQNTQAIWWTNDVEFPVEITKDEEGNIVEQQVKPQNGEWFQSYTTGDGRTPIVRPLTAPYDYGGMLQNVLARRSLILQKCNVPQRNDNSGGSTGIAMSDATGWSAAESAATKQQSIMEACKMREAKVVLAAIKNSPHVKASDPLKTIRLKDLQVNIKRQKTYEMITKSNALSVLISTGISGLHAIKAVNFFDDPNQVWEDSKDIIEAIQKRAASDSQTLKAGSKVDSDASDQVSNSPLIDGIRTENISEQKEVRSYGSDGRVRQAKQPDIEK